MAGQAAQLYLLRFSRSQEYEADQVGVRLLAGADYDPVGQAEFLDTLGKWASLEAQIAGRQAAPPEFLSTHPNTANRVRRAAAEAQVLGQGAITAEKSRDVYLNAIDGLLYGDDPVKHGFVRGRDFIHPGMGFAFTAPNGFQLQNSSQAVLARASSGAQMQFSGANSDQSPTALIDGPLSQSLKVDLSPARTINVNGRQGAVGQARANTQNGQVDVTAYAINWQGTTNYIFLWVTPANQTSQLQGAMDQTVRSLRTIDVRSANAPPANRIDVVAVRASDTAASLSQYMAFPDHKEARFRVINSMDSSEQVRAGQRVKIVR